MHIDECPSGIVTSRSMINSALLVLVRQSPTLRAAIRSSWHTMMKQLLESAKLVVIGDVSTTMCSHSEAACRSPSTASKGHSRRSLIESTVLTCELTTVSDEMTRCLANSRRLDSHC